MWETLCPRDTPRFRNTNNPCATPGGFQGLKDTKTLVKFILYIWAYHVTFIKFLLSFSTIYLMNFKYKFSGKYKKKQDHKNKNIFFCKVRYFEVSSILSMIWLVISDSKHSILEKKYVFILMWSYRVFQKMGVYICESLFWALNWALIFRYSSDNKHTSCNSILHSKCCFQPPSWFF